MLLYIDPGTGAMLFSLATGLISIAWFGFRKLWVNLKYRTTRKVDNDKKAIPLVIFSDDKRYWPVFEPVIKELNARSFPVTYMTQSKDDPGLDASYENLQAEFIGASNSAFAKLNFLKATMLLSTTPGLDVYQWKRSKDVKYYIHIIHAPSELTTYRMFGVDFYDALLLSGQHQVDDCRALEKLRNEPEKECIIVGIPYLDEEAEKLKMSSTVHHGRTILVAPSWGSNSLLNRFGNKLIDQLISTNYHVIIRPHPQSFSSEKQLIEKMMKDYPNLEWNKDTDNFNVLNRSDILISDFSGVIFDFALVFDKPVICAYTDFDKSVYDAWWLDSPILSASILPMLGPILKEDNINDIRKLIDTAVEDKTYEISRHEVKNKIWMYQGESAKKSADYLIKKYHELTNEADTNSLLKNNNH